MLASMSSLLPGSFAVGTDWRDPAIIHALMKCERHPSKLCVLC